MDNGQWIVGVIHYSLFTIHYSLFTIHYSLKKLMTYDYIYKLMTRFFKFPFLLTKNFLKQ